MSTKAHLTTLGLCAILLSTAACSTNSQYTHEKSKVSASKTIDDALNQAMHTQTEQGNKLAALQYAERLYKRHSADPKIVAQYGAALRNNGLLEQAELIISPLAHKQYPAAPILAEFAAIKIANGQHTKAEAFAKQALERDEKNFKAHHYLGITLDAQEKHKDAEKSFRAALDNWEGDPTSVMNNLALNLSSQGQLFEASEILHEAKSLAPQRIEIERNLRIITALIQSHSGHIPKPAAKPEATQDPMTTSAISTPAEPLVIDTEPLKSKEPAEDENSKS